MRSHFEGVQIFELKRVGGTPKGHLFEGVQIFELKRVGSTSKSHLFAPLILIRKR